MISQLIIMPINLDLDNTFYAIQSQERANH